MAELFKIRKRINNLLDRYNGTTDPQVKEQITVLLEKERVKLDQWKQEHGYG